MPEYETTVQLLSLIKTFFAKIDSKRGLIYPRFTVVDQFIRREGTIKAGFDRSIVRSS